MPRKLEDLPADVVQAAQVLWDWHDPHDELHPVDVAIGLGSHDIGVAAEAARLYHQGLFPLLVFTGANAPTTKDVFPRGEAVHYREHAIDLGVPADRILIETAARNTGENFTNTRDLLAAQDIHPRTVLIITRPYHRRRSWATCRKQWPEVDPITAAEPTPMADYMNRIGDPEFVIVWLVGEIDRIRNYPRQEVMADLAVPSEPSSAFNLLASRGYLLK
jgi:uncharacterized SAM-binding protein YcdF (DUF218 family)